MRYLFALIIVFLSSAPAYGQEAEFSIDNALHKFPKVKEGVILEHFYIITNTGSAPLIISEYKVSCSCTKAFLPKDPILPGESYKLKVSFDTNGKYYLQDRIIYLKTNTKKETHRLRFKVKVIPKSTNG
jgi:hypothetical protein